MSNLPPSLRGLALAAAALAASTTALAATDAEIVAALDTEFQAAVARNDWRTMDRILHPDFVLVIGRGTVVDRATLLENERSKRRYEQQVEMPGTQTVRLFKGRDGADTAVVTALLWLKGENLETHASFDYKLWFSDTYVRTKDGWKYAFGQAAQPLPAEPAKP